MRIFKQTHFPVNNELRRTYTRTQMITPTTDTCTSEKKTLTNVAKPQCAQRGVWFICGVIGVLALSAKEQRVQVYSTYFIVTLHQCCSLVDTAFNLPPQLLI